MAPPRSAALQHTDRPDRDAGLNTDSPMAGMGKVRALRHSVAWNKVDPADMLFLGLMRRSKEHRECSVAWLSAGATLFALVACDDGVHPAADAGVGDAPDPGLTVLVSFEGNDADDGINRPVETIQRALAIAATNPRVTHIELAAGRYTMRGGEVFPYTVPPHIIGFSGPSGGVAVLEGTGAERGLIVSGGQLQNLAFENFATAIDATGTSRFKNLRIARSSVGIHASRGAGLRIDNLDIVGDTAGSRRCAKGIVLDGMVHLTITNWTTRDLGGAIQILNHAVFEPGVVDIARANFTSAAGSMACPGSVVGVLGADLTLSDSVIDGGFTGISPAGPAPFTVTIANTTLQNLEYGLFGNGIVRISDSSITDSKTGVVAGSSSWSLTNVTIARNALGITVNGDEFNGRATLTMRGCTVTDNRGSGIALGDHATGDLGTEADPGNNVITFNSLGLTLFGSMGQTQVEAVGNTWNPSVQGADADGRYLTVETIQGPFPATFRENFDVADGWSLRR
jgi:hypothetical protein